MADNTTTQAAASGTQLSTSSVPSSTRKTEIEQSTKEALSDYFPDLNKLDSIVKYCMNIWWSESNFNCFHSSGNSRHNAIVTGTPVGSLVSDNLADWKYGRDFYSRYWKDTNIVNKRITLGQSPAIIDGLYAHGVSATMGAYHIKGCQACSDTFSSSKYLGIATDNGLLVEPGNRVTTIYTEDVAGRKRSIIAGLIILDWHYHQRLGMPMLAVDRKGNSPYLLLTAIGYPIFSGGLTASNFLKGTLVTPSQAILLAAGDYLGFGRDINGATGIDRAKFVRDNSSWPYRDASSTRTAANSNATPAKQPGCAS